MKKSEALKNLRNKLKSKPSIGSWIQISNSTISEIIGNSGYDWAAVDLEHGQISHESLPDIFRSLELGSTLPIARLAEANTVDCKKVLDAGAVGIIIPKIESSKQFIEMRDAARWPPSGKRGVGFSRANLFGKYFNEYSIESQNPFLVAMIESKKGLENIDEILKVKGLDAIFIGPYDLSASLGITGEFNSKIFINSISLIKEKCKNNKIPCGIHVVEPSLKDLDIRINEGYKFIAYSMDTMHLRYGLESVFNK
jgi:2-dehydro-3-deoxyglucarate aldolase